MNKEYPDDNGTYTFIREYEGGESGVLLNYYWNQ